MGLRPLMSVCALHGCNREYDSYYNRFFTFFCQHLLCENFLEANSVRCSKSQDGIDRPKAQPWSISYRWLSFFSWIDLDIILDLFVCCCMRKRSKGKRKLHFLR